VGGGGGVGGVLGGGGVFGGFVGGGVGGGCSVFRGGRVRFAVCVFQGGRWVPVRVLPSASFVGLGVLRLPWWVVLDGNGSGFRELGVRFPARRFLRWLKRWGVLERGCKRLKRVVVYVKGKEVHVDVATSLTRDEVVLLGASAHWRELVAVFAAVAAACLAAGVDKRFLHSLLAALRVV